VTVVVRRGVILLTLIAVSGCGGGGKPAASKPSQPLIIPTPTPTPTGRPHPARPGTVCGEVKTVTGARARVSVVRGRVTCDETMRVFEKYNDPATPAEGTAGLAVIGHWTCETRGTITRCTLKGTTIQSRS
jgi:hypothetical protein